MNQANVERLVSSLRYKVQPRRRLPNLQGPSGRIRKIQKTLTALLKYERIEMNYPRADETRGYVDLLISEAIRHGPTHKETMELADFWILEKEYVHKLFKVLVPRYENYTTSYTSIYKAPKLYPGTPYDRAVFELRGNMYPSLNQQYPNQKYLLHNILLAAAHKDFTVKDVKDSKDVSEEAIVEREEQKT